MSTKILFSLSMSVTVAAEDGMDLIEKLAVLAETGQLPHVLLLDINAVFHHHLAKARLH